MNFNNNDKIKMTNPIHGELEQEVKDKLEAIDKNADDKGRQLATEKLPRLLKDKLSVYVAFIRSACRQVIKLIDKTLQTNKLDEETARDKEYTHKVISGDEGKRAEAIHAKKSFTVQLERITETYNWKKYPLIMVLLVVLAIIQIGIDSSSLQGFGFVLVTSILFATGIGVASVIISHNIKKIMGMVEKTWQRALIFLGVSIMFAIVFLILASLRTAFGGHDASVGEILAFVGLNELLIIGTLALAYFELPSVIDEQKKLKRKELQKEIDLFNKTIQELTEKINSDSKALYERIELRELHKQYAIELKEFVGMSYESSVDTFVSTNSVSRTDGIPDCFENDIPPLLNHTKKENK